MSELIGTRAVRMNGLIATVLLLSSWLAVGQASADDEHEQCIELSNGTNDAWSECSGAYLTRINAQLEASWQKVFPSLTEEGQTFLDVEQQAWTSFKDRSCLYYENGEYGRGGQVLHFAVCRGRIIEDRIQYLDELVDFVTIEGE